MRIYNPTIETIVGAYDGVNYYISPGHTLSLSNETANWILSHNRDRGLVEINPPSPLPDGFNLQNYIVRKSMEGLEKYIIMQEGRLESYINLDTELKAQNVYGTVLKQKPVKEITRNIEIAMATIKELEAKYGFSIMKSDVEEKSKIITSSIETTLALFENDVEAQSKANEQEKELNQLIKEMIPTMQA